MPGLDARVCLDAPKEVREEAIRMCNTIYAATVEDKDAETAWRVYSEE
jgi:hypothetical protein